ncbi:hypothetical protein KIL84_005582, partial [Mauremys mutica]
MGSCFGKHQLEGERGAALTPSPSCPTSPPDPDCQPATPWLGQALASWRWVFPWLGRAHPPGLMALGFPVAGKGPSPWPHGVGFSPGWEGPIPLASWRWVFPWLGRAHPPGLMAVSLPVSLHKQTLTSLRLLLPHPTPSCSLIKEAIPIMSHCSNPCFKPQINSPRLHPWVGDSI